MIRRLLLVVLVFAAAGGGYWWFALRPASPAAAAGASGPGGHGPDTIPVTLAAAETRDVPIFLDGLGTAQASATVTVKAQVDGTLTEVRFREGQDVHAGDVLARIDPRSYQAALDQAVAKKAQDQANLANAKLDAARYAKLAATAYTSAQQSDTARSTVAQLEAQAAQDQAQIDTAKVNVGYTTVVAPIDGRVGIRQVDQGNVVHASDATGIAVITTLKPISVVFTLPQQTLPSVAAAQAIAQPEVLALPQGTTTGGGKPIDRGTLTVLDNQVDPATGTIKLKASFPNDKLLLWPGAFVNVRLKVETRQGATTVPPVAVQRGPQGAYVYVVVDNVANRRAVHVDHEDQSVSIIGDGLKPGEQVVIDGAARLSEGSKVTTGTPPDGEQPARRRRG